jgi:hypothetical protein
MEQWWEYECERGRERWEEVVRVLLCAPPPRLRHSLSFLVPQLTKPLHARAPTPTGGAQSFPSAVFGGVQPTSLAFRVLQLSCCIGSRWIGEV